jgi:hypothetical protein
VWCGGEDKEVGVASECGGMGGGTCKIAYSCAGLVGWKFCAFPGPWMACGPRG